LKPQRTYLRATAQEKSVFFILNCKPHLPQVPSWCSQLLISTLSAWECNLKRATLRCVCLPKSTGADADS